MKKLSSQAWLNYIKRLNGINKQARNDLKKWILQWGVDENGNLLDNINEAVDGFDRSFPDYCYAIVQEYSDASGALSAAMYDAIAELEGAAVPAAEMVKNATLSDIYKTVNGVLKTSRNVDEMTGAVTRYVKKASCDTMLQNAYRDRAQYAWIPIGDTCSFCMALAAQGWVNVSVQKIRKGYPHAEHIHSDCDCNYAVRFNSDTEVAGYDPGKYEKMFYEAGEWSEQNGGDYPSFGWNGMNFFTSDAQSALRRKNYQENKDKINEQKRSAYAKRKETESSEAEETNVK